MPKDKRLKLGLFLMLNCSHLKEVAVRDSARINRQRLQFPNDLADGIEKALIVLPFEKYFLPRDTTVHHGGRRLRDNGYEAAAPRPGIFLS